MTSRQWISKNLIGSIIAFILTAILGFLVTLFVFFIEARHTDIDHETALSELKLEIKEFRTDIKEYMKIAIELRYELFVYQQQKRGVNQDSTEMIIDLN